MVLARVYYFDESFFIVEAKNYAQTGHFMRFLGNKILKYMNLKGVCCEGHWLAKSDTVRLSTERTPADTNCCFRNKFILVVTYGKAPCFYFLENALSLR